MSFAPNIGDIPGMSGGSALGGLTGPLASEVASHLGPLGGLAGQLGTVQRAAQLAQTGFSLMQKTPETVAGTINGAAGTARLTQQNRYITIETPLGPDVLLVSAAVIDEHVNALPTIHLDLLSHRHDLTIDDLIGQRVKIKLDQQSQQSVAGRIVAGGDSGDEVRHFDGYVMSLDRAGSPGKVTQYQMTVVPWFWILTRSTDCRIFQNVTVTDILTTIFHEHGFSDFAFDLHSQYKPLEYVVMYQESYYNFCARLMEQEGLIWTHRYEKDKHILAIGDTNLLFRPVDGLKTLSYSNSQASELNGIDRLNEGRRFGVGKVTFRDFNHQNPSSPLMMVEATPQNLKHARLADTERFEHQSLYDHSEDGDRYARFSMEAEEVEAHRYTGSGYAWRLTTAGITTVTGHPVAANNQEYVFLQVRHEAVNDYTQQAAKLPYRNTFVCLPRKIAYRAQRQTPKPVVHGTQSAIVVGPKGEQIYTNGSCVKVHFIWDRRGKMDGTDSMWIRVSQPWAGNGWGGAAIPRIGQEVNISFNQGDPDNPMIIGRVFNGDNGNPYHGAAGQTMGIKSQTHKGEGSNELSMSDVNGAQMFYMHAQKDMHTVVQDAQKTEVLKGNRTIEVGKGDHKTTVAVGDLTDLVTQGDTLHKTPQGSHTIETSELWIKVGGDGGTVLHMTKDAIELIKGNSVIHLDAKNINVQAARTDINPKNAP